VGGAAGEAHDRQERDRNPRRHDRGIEFQHNSCTFGGYDQHGEIALVECCAARLHEIHTAGFYSHCNYDFLAGGKNTNENGYSVEQVVDAISTFRQAIAAADKDTKDISRRGGVNMSHAPVRVLDHPWKTDDRNWFEQHPERSHRARLPFAGEVKPEEMGSPPEGHQPLMLIRQVEPDRRIRPGFFIPNQMLPVPDAEAVVHALFEIDRTRADTARRRGNGRTDQEIHNQRPGSLDATPCTRSNLMERWHDRNCTWHRTCLCASWPRGVSGELAGRA